MSVHGPSAFPFAYSSGAAKPGVYAFGVNSDQNGEPGRVVSSAVLDIPKAFEDVAKSVQAHAFKGKTIAGDLKSGDVKVVDNPKFASLFTAAQTAKMAAARQGLIDGKIVLPGAPKL